MIISCVEPHLLLTHDDMKALVLDFLVFGNAYLEARRNRLGQVIRLIRTPAKYMRRGEQAGRYWFVKSWMEEHEFAPDSVFHLMNPDIHQEIYGLPEYLAGLVSASLSQVATLFRTRFFENGSHAGVLVHLTDALADPEGAKKLEQALSSARGNGAFRNVFVHTVAVQRTASR
ncbi:Phage portal protein [Sodalis glossinidius str. 'morsitans']|uniref:Phage portal protein n=2 Tax=Sodalis glossinidius TaxID=63612 RepID=A0A193QG69_SODGM|nr:Phage portal protein [Sodalis glossinidius str. 'morsitans']